MCCSFRVALQRKVLGSASDSETFIRAQIKAYLISHGHLDHLSGFLLNTPNDQAGKFIIALNETVMIIREHYFNNQAWADFGSTGLKVCWHHFSHPHYIVYDRSDLRLSNSRSIDKWISTHPKYGSRCPHLSSLSHVSLSKFRFSRFPSSNVSFYSLLGWYRSGWCGENSSGE